MRWALVKVALAATAMVVVAFALPLGLVIKEMASDRAFAGCRAERGRPRPHPLHHHRPPPAGEGGRLHPRGRGRPGRRPCARVGRTGQLGRPG